MIEVIALVILYIEILCLIPVVIRCWRDRFGDGDLLYNDLEKATQDQYLCDRWFAVRKTKLTFSRFGLICK